MGRKRRESDLDAELRAHLAMAAQDARERGQSAEAARLAALREFGNRELVKETTRDIWGRNPFHGIVDDLRSGLRMFRKNPGFAAILVLTLALGIGANTAIFSLIDAVMLRSLPVSHPEQLVQVRISLWRDRNGRAHACGRCSFLWRSGGYRGLPAGAAGFTARSDERAS
jgi:macrolide transport system ATP-binding/permease protein